MRWGRSAYESDSDLALERSAVEAVGGVFSLAATHEKPELNNVDVLVVTSKVKVTEQVLRRFGGELVITTTSGFDHIDVAAASAQGKRVARSPMARRDAVVEHALGAMILMRRRLFELQRAAQQDHWARGELPNLAPLGLLGARVGVVGCGVIGSQMCSVLKLLGAQVWGHDPKGVPQGVVEVDKQGIARCDVITLHCNLSPTSRSYLDAEFLRSLASHTVIINTARGPSLDVVAAVELVKLSRLAGLTVDVFQTEPWPHLQEMTAVDGVWFTPHSSGYTIGLGRRVAEDVSLVLKHWCAHSSLPATHRVV